MGAPIGNPTLVAGIDPIHYVIMSKVPNFPARIFTEIWRFRNFLKWQIFRKIGTLGFWLNREIFPKIGASGGRFNRDFWQNNSHRNAWFGDTRILGYQQFGFLVIFGYTQSLLLIIINLPYFMHLPCHHLCIHAFAIVSKWMIWAYPDFRK